MDERSQNGHPAASHASPWPNGPQGFVVPGIAAGFDSPPMSAHDGTIGGTTIAVPAAVPQPPYGHPYQQAPAPVHATGPDLADQQPQAWAFPTPHGLRLVQPGAATNLLAADPSFAAPGAHAVRTRRRIRWETIVPSVAVLCLLASVCFFIHDFDRMTGRHMAKGGAATAAAANGDAGDAKATEPAAAPRATPQVAKPATRAGMSPKAKARVQALLQRLRGERARRRWSAAITTLGQLEAVRPLNAAEQAIRTSARQSLRRERAAAKRAAAARRSGPASSSRGGGAPTPPGASTGGAAARPPAAAPKAGVPARPNIPNPTGTSGGGGASAVGAAPSGGGSAGAASGGGGGASSNCQWMVMDGVSMCM
jgi:hypothetical protein